MEILDQIAEAKQHAAFTALNEVERNCIVKHGYGLHSFAHALVDTFERLAPSRIVSRFIKLKNDKTTKSDRIDDFWDQFGDDTIACMQDGTHLLAVLWESAWEGRSSIADADFTHAENEPATPMLRGLALPADVLLQIYHGNAIRLLRG